MRHITAPCNNSFILSPRQQVLVAHSSTANGYERYGYEIPGIGNGPGGNGKITYDAKYEQAYAPFETAVEQKQAYTCQAQQVEE